MCYANHLIHPISTSGVLISIFRGVSRCFSPVLLLSLSLLAFLSPLFQRHMTTPFKKLNKFLSAKMLQFVCPGLGSQNFLFLRLPIRQSFQLPVLLPKQDTCFQVIKAHARCSLAKKQKEEQVVSPVSGPGSKEEEGRQSKQRTRFGNLVKL